MQDCATVADLLMQFGPPHHKVPQDGFEIWHYPLGIESGMVYSIHVSVWPDQNRQTYLYFEPASENAPTRRPRALLKKTILALVALALIGNLAIYQYLKPDWQRARFEKNLKHRITPEELRTWALGILQTYGTHKQHDNAHITNSHPALDGLFQNPPTVWWYSESPPDTEFVRVTYGGGGFGHFGVEIGPTNRAQPSSSDARKYSSWAPGIYFFNGQ